MQRPISTAADPTPPAVRPEDHAGARGPSPLRRLAGWLAGSALLSRGRRLYTANEQDYLLPMSKADKLLAGAYLILRDYASGVFPPRFSDQAAVYAAEKKFQTHLIDMTAEAARDCRVRKPFWDYGSTERYLRGYLKLFRALDTLGVRPPSSLLELGCGTGWMTEFLSLNQYDVLGTTLVESEVAEARCRLASLAALQLKANLDFLVAPMESVHEHVPASRRFDAVFVYEALHHAFSWEATIASAHQVLKPGGWLLIANEPNLLHTFVSYRQGRLSNTHEIGLSRRQMLRELRRVGFRETRDLGCRFHAWVLPHWIAGRK